MSVYRRIAALCGRFVLAGKRYAGNRQQQSHRPPCHPAHGRNGKNRPVRAALRGEKHPLSCCRPSAVRGRRTPHLCGNCRHAGMWRRCLFRQRQDRNRGGLDGFGAGFPCHTETETEAGGTVPAASCAHRGTEADRRGRVRQRGRDLPSGPFYRGHAALRNGTRQRGGFCKVGGRGAQGAWHSGHPRRRD